MHFRMADTGGKTTDVVGLLWEPWSNAYATLAINATLPTLAGREGFTGYVVYEMRFV